jgi:Icc protein
MPQPETQFQSAAQTALKLKVQGRPLKVLQLSDCHILERSDLRLFGMDTEASLKEVLAQVQASASWPPDVILLTGDLVQDPSPLAYARLRRLLEPLPVPWVALPGNHDDPKTLTEILGPPHCVKRLLTETWQIIALNTHLPGSAGGYLAADELEFLSVCLQDPRYALIALHHPPLPVHSAWMDSMALSNGREFLTLLERFANVKGVIFGHVHQVFEASYGQIKLWSAPSTCFQFQPESPTLILDASPAGWRWLELDQGQIQTWVERL